MTALIHTALVESAIYLVAAWLVSARTHGLHSGAEDPDQDPYPKY